MPGLSGLAAVLVLVGTLLPDGPGGSGWLLAAGLALAGGLLTARERRRLRTVERLIGERGPCRIPPRAGERRGQGVLPLAWEGRRAGGC